MSKISVVIIFLFSLNSSYSQWIQTNGPTGGTVKSIACNDNYIFAVAGNSKIYRSLNDCEDWKLLTNGLDSLSGLPCIAVSNKNVIAGTYNGIYLSTDNGDNWNKVFNDVRVNEIKIYDNKIFASTLTGLYLSSNNGGDWAKISMEIKDIPNIGVKCIAYDGKNLFAVYIINEDFGDLIVLGIYLSTNDGESWSKVSSDFTYNTVNCLAFNGLNIYAGLNYGGILFSSDNGVKWNSISNVLPNSINCIIFKDSIMYVGTMLDGIIRTTNNGKNLDTINKGLSNKSIQCFAIKNGSIFTGTNSGVCLSTDTGNNWIIKNKGLAATNVQAMIEINGSIIAGTYLCGISKSSDDGNTWKETDLDISHNTIKKLAKNGNNIFAAIAGNYGDHDIFWSSDAGDNWKLMNPIPIININFAIIDMIYHNDFLFAATSQGIYKTSDYGENWIELDTNLRTIYIVDLWFSDQENMMYACSNNGIYVSANNGNNWDFVNPNLKYTYCIETNKNNIYSCHFSEFFISTDYGINWTKSNLNVDNLFIKCITLKGNNIFLGTYSGIFLSTNNGLDWKAFNTGLPNLTILSLVIKENMIYAGCAGYGIFKSYLSDFGITDVGENKSDINDITISPNPAGDYIEISSFYPTLKRGVDEYYDIQIFDILGTIVASIDQMTASHRMNIENLSPGMYFIKIRNRVSKFVKM